MLKSGAFNRGDFAPPSAAIIGEVSATSTEDKDFEIFDLRGRGGIVGPGRTANSRDLWAWGLDSAREPGLEVYRRGGRTCIELGMSHVFGYRFSFLSFSVPSRCIQSQALTFLFPTHLHQFFSSTERESFRHQGAACFWLINCCSMRLFMDWVDELALFCIVWIASLRGIASWGWRRADSLMGSHYADCHVVLHCEDCFVKAALWGLPSEVAACGLRREIAVWGDRIVRLHHGDRIGESHCEIASWGGIRPLP